MQMKFMTWSAYFKGLCVTSRHFHGNKAIFKNLQANEVLRKGVLLREDDTFRSARSLLVSDCKL